jgi:hypothetical protein
MSNMTNMIKAKNIATPRWRPCRDRQGAAGGNGRRWRPG